MAAAVIFDLDGTLIDSAPDLRDAVNAMLARRGADPVDLPSARRFIGNGGRMLVRRALAARGLPEEDPTAYDEFLAHYLKASDHAPAFYPGARALLERLDPARCGLCTNKPREATDIALRAAGVTALFGAVVGGGDTHLKPDPAPLALCAERLGAAAADCVFVGDSEVDADTARAAGARFVLHRNGYLRGAPEDTGAAFSFDDFAALGDWLDAALSCS